MAAPDQDCGDEEVEVFVEGRFMLVSRERAQLLTEYEGELEELLSLIRYGRPRILEALGLKDQQEPECNDWCCRG